MVSLLNIHIRNITYFSAALPGSNSVCPLQGWALWGGVRILVHFAACVRTGMNCRSHTQGHAGTVFFLGLPSYMKRWGRCSAPSMHSPALLHCDVQVYQMSVIFIFSMTEWINSQQQRNELVVTRDVKV